MTPEQIVEVVKKAVWEAGLNDYASWDDAESVAGDIARAAIRAIAELDRDRQKQVRIPAFSPCTEVENALGFVVSRASAIYGLKNGETALYWHLVGVLAQHMKNPDSESVERARAAYRIARIAFTAIIDQLLKELDEAGKES